MKKILNIIVYYDNDEEVDHYITQVMSISRQFVDIWVVVNKDEKGRLRELQSRRSGDSRITFINHGGNVGYLNSLLTTIKDRDISGYDYVILSNTDIEYKDPEFFNRILATEYTTDIGCIAPSVYNPNTGSYSNPHYRERVPEYKFKRIMRIFAFPMLADAYLKLAGMKAGSTKSTKCDSCYVYSPHGSYMIFTREFLSKIKGYEYGVRMYSEESCIGELLRREKMRCFYDSTIEVIHLESSVTGGMNQKRRFWMWRDSVRYILDEFYKDGK